MRSLSPREPHGRAITAAVRAAATVVVTLVAVVLAGCGYHLVGTTSFLPDEVRDLHVRPFTNQTNWADVDQRIAESLNQEWVRRRRFQLVNEEADAQVVLGGTITSVNIAPVTFDERGRATEYQMTLRAEVYLDDVRGDEPERLWEDKAFQRRTSYTVDVSAVDYFDRQVEAMDILSREFARALVSAMLEGF